MTDSSPPFSTRLLIDTQALADNWRLCANHRPDAECGAVVKADAYGLGIGNVVPVLSEAGCTTFFVAQLEEGMALRTLVPHGTIYVLSGLVPENGDLYARHQLRPVLGSLEELREWSAFCAATGWQGGAALHVDTGMSRLGLHLDQAKALKAEGDLFKPVLVMTHLACADVPGHPLTARQFKAFDAARALYPGVPASMCNSAGVFYPADIGFELLRPGVALYGGNPTPGKPNPMKPAVTALARVLLTRSVAPGDFVGYGATWSSRTPARIAVIGIGYADGYLRAGSSSEDFDSAIVHAAGKYCHVAGRISMDMTAIDISELPEGAVKRGDWVEVFGRHLPVDEVARRAGTISYEILTGIGSRYHRELVAESTCHESA